MRCRARRGGLARQIEPQHSGSMAHKLMQHGSHCPAQARQLARLAKFGTNQRRPVVTPRASLMEAKGSRSLERPVTTPVSRRSDRSRDNWQLLTVLRRCALLLLCLGLIWVAWGLLWGATEEPWEWQPGNDPVLKSRPGLRHHERYSPEHRYRPAASPIIRETDRWGRVKIKGDYL